MRKRAYNQKRGTSGLFAIHRSSPFDEEAAATHSNEARLAWHRMCTGEGTCKDFDELAMTLNTLRVLSEKLGPEPLEVVSRAAPALLDIRARYVRTRKFGVDAAALATVPDALDLYDEFLRVSTPMQMEKAWQTVLKRLAK